MRNRDIIYILIICVLLAYGANAHFAYMKLKFQHDTLVATLNAPKAAAGKILEAWKERKKKGE